MSHVGKGVALAIANTFVVTSCITVAVANTAVLGGGEPRALYYRHPALLPLFIASAMPASGLGALLGALAGRLRGERVATLLAASFAALACVTALASPLIDVPQTTLLEIAWIPTSFATIALERWTRLPEIASAWVVAPSGSDSGSRERRARTASCT